MGRLLRVRLTLQPSLTGGFFIYTSLQPFVHFSRLFSFREHSILMNTETFYLSSCVFDIKVVYLTKINCSFILFAEN